MNDDELIERLRRTLHDQAESIRPSPGWVPEPGATWTQGAAPGPVPGGTVGPGPAVNGSGPLGPPGDEDRQTAEYLIVTPTGPVPIVGRGERRWPLIGAGALLAAAIAVVVGLVLSQSRHPVHIPPTHSLPATSVQPVPTTVLTPVPPASLVPSAPTTVVPAQVAVPTGFRPMSVTFVSPQVGWSFGFVYCPSDVYCPVLAHTGDAGLTWSSVNPPPISGPHVGGAWVQPTFAVRFADAEDGWVYTQGNGYPSAQLWATHDGGASWKLVPLPVAGATIGDLEAAGGYGHIVVYGPCQTGTSGCQGQTVEQILTSPVQSDDWKATGLEPAPGAASALQPQITLWGDYGWLVNDNRTVVSGARLQPGPAGWVAWQPACSNANGPGYVAAASATDISALCAEGIWGRPDPGTSAGHNWLFHSSDGGMSFTSIGVVPGSNPQSFTVAPGHDQTIVVADGQLGLEASFDGGLTWGNVASGSTSGQSYSYVGFTTAAQGVAIRNGPTTELFMTRDGGHTWSAVHF